MSQESIKTSLDKINLLFNVFMKEGLDKVSNLEKELLKEQIQKLLEELDKLDTHKSTLAQAPVVNIEKKEEQKESPIQESFLISNEELQVVGEEEVIVEVEEEVVEVAISTAPVEPSKGHDMEDLREFSKNKPSRSLKEIIDLNKSFILKEELFGNNHETYTQFISNLNAFQTEEESMNLVEATAKELSWDTEDKVYELLLRAVEKRFLPLLQQ
jgi:hypothetical protein